jgi:hypothetical protein
MSAISREVRCSRQRRIRIIILVRMGEMGQGIKLTDRDRDTPPSEALGGDMNYVFCSSL